MRTCNIIGRNAIVVEHWTHNSCHHAAVDAECGSAAAPACRPKFDLPSVRAGVAAKAKRWKRMSSAAERQRKTCSRVWLLPPLRGSRNIVVCLPTPVSRPGLHSVAAPRLRDIQLEVGIGPIAYVATAALALQSANCFQGNRSDEKAPDEGETLSRLGLSEVAGARPSAPTWRLSSNRRS
jgi:hypothetical protein